MPIFVILCLILAVLVQSESQAVTMLVSMPVLYGGLVAAIATIIGSFLKKIPETICYDIFASSTLFVWLAYWKPLFVSDSPIFFFYPVYFALIVAFVTLFFIGKRNKIDKDSRRIMQSTVDSGIVDPWILMSCVLITLYFENRFIQFPTFMTLLVMRYTLTGCLKPMQTEK